MCRLSRIATLLIALISLFIAAPSYAQMTPQAQFARGQELFEGHKYEEALPYFRNAFDRTKSPNANLYVARCLEKLGRLDEAYKEMQITVTIATQKAADDKKYAVTRDAAAGELAQLGPRVGLLVIAFTEDYLDAKVMVDDRELVASEIGVPLPVMPGTITIVGSASGRESVTKTEDVAGGQTRTIALALPEAIEKTPGPGPEGGDFVITPMRIAGFAVAGAGVVGMVVFAITGAMALKKHSIVSDACGGMTCPDTARVGDIDAGKRLATIANVSVALGGTALIAGGLLILLGGPDEDEGPAAEGEVSLVASPGGIGVGVSF